jgi:hypothetical protein
MEDGGDEGDLCASVEDLVVGEGSIAVYIVVCDVVVSAGVWLESPWEDETV